MYGLLLGLKVFYSKEIYVMAQNVRHTCVIVVIQQQSVCNLQISEEQECHSQLQQFEGESAVCTKVNY